ncbi:MAG TPA: hypothetical protein VL974_06960 [Magnetospirillum sp.]|jgi:hypothetical protein|nr:hypothetical protein [Magnetospirillum sp.]
MGWADRVREGWQWALNTDIGRQLAQRAKDKVDEGLDKIVTGQPQEGERLIEEGKADAQQAAETERRENPPS